MEKEKDERKEPDGLADDAAHEARLMEESEVSDRLLTEWGAFMLKLSELVGECPAHGPACKPHVLHRVAELSPGINEHCRPPASDTANSLAQLALNEALDSLGTGALARRAKVCAGGDAQACREAEADVVGTWSEIPSLGDRWRARESALERLWATLKANPGRVRKIDGTALRSLGISWSDLYHQLYYIASRGSSDLRPKGTSPGLDEIYVSANPIDSAVKPTCLPEAAR